MIEATSCGGVVIFRGKILVLYKNYRNKYEGWVLPKGTVEPGEEYRQTALREVYEETGVHASIIKYVGKSQYTFHIPQDVVDKEVHWYLMMSDSYASKPQREEFFVDSGYLGREPVADGAHRLALGRDRAQRRLQREPRIHAGLPEDPGLDGPRGRGEPSAPDLRRARRDARTR